MRKLLGVALLAGASFLTVQPAGAVSSAPAVRSGSDNVIQVAGGCGPYAYRGYDGYCRGMRYAYSYAPPPPVVYYRPVCGYGWRPTPWGCRPIW